jgi:hypothetical protein
MIRFCFITLVASLMSSPAIEPGAPVDYSKLAFYPKRWEQKEFEMTLTPWKGREVAFTNSGRLTEKPNRLATSPSDQPVMYASAMLSLWKEHGNDWLKGFFRQLATCEEKNWQARNGAQTQCLSWYLVRIFRCHRCATTLAG